jgi:tRNA(Ile)-lysidine synthetase-like protein
LVFIEISGQPYGPEHTQVEILTQAIRAPQVGQLIKCAHNVLVYMSYHHVIFVHLRIPRRTQKGVILGKIFALLKKSMVLEAVQPQLSSRTRTVRIERFALHRLKTPVVYRLNGWQVSLKRVRITATLRQKICRQSNASALIQYYDIDGLNFPLQIRSRRTGDRFQPFGNKGTQRLKQFFIDMKIPLYLRDYIPLLCDKQQILWVIGVRRGDGARITPSSKHAMRVEISHSEQKHAAKKSQRLS